MAAGSRKRRTLVMSPVTFHLGPVPIEEGHHECSGHDYRTPDLERHACGSRAPVIAVAILAALLIANVGNDSSASPKTVVPTQSSTPGSTSRVALGTRADQLGDPRDWAPGGVRRGTSVLSSKKAGLASVNPAYALMCSSSSGRELSALEECIAAADLGEGRLVVISGEAGVGKTSLVKELGCRGSAAQMLSGQAPPLQTPRALGPLIDVALAAGGDPALAESDDRHRLFAEFLAVCSLDGPPTVVVLEDLHWADGDAPFLTFAGHEWSTARCARRDVPRRPGARSSAADGAGRSRDRPVRRLRLEPLSASAVATLVASTRGIRLRRCASVAGCRSS